MVVSKNNETAIPDIPNTALALSRFKSSQECLKNCRLINFFILNNNAFISILFSPNC